MAVSNKKKVYDAIRHKLLLGELMPGARLSEVKMAKEMGVSRTPVREAFNQLGRDGLLDNLPHDGTFVTKLSRDEVAELFDLRELLETYAARRAAEKISEVQLDELRKNCMLMKAINREIVRTNLVDLKGTQALRWKVCDVAFHSSLIAGSDSTRINRIIRDFHILTNLCLRAHRDKSIRLRDNVVRVLKEHEAIVEALSKRNADQAAKLISKHLQEGKRQALVDYEPEKLDQFFPQHAADGAIEKILGY